MMAGSANAINAATTGATLAKAMAQQVDMAGSTLRLTYKAVASR